MDIGHLMRRLGPTDLDQPALSLEAEETWTYRDLRDRVYRYANGLLDSGVRKGDRIGVLLYNSLEYWALYLAATSIGAIVVRLNWRLAPEELQYALSDSGCTVLCMHDDFAAPIDAIRAGTPVKTGFVFPYSGAQVPGWVEDLARLESATADPPPVADPSPRAAAVIMYTSGTTGRPKGAMLTHEATTWWGAMQVMEWQYQRDSTTTMTTGPLYHVSSLEDLGLPALLIGAHTIVCRSRGFSVERMLRNLEHHRVTDTFIFPVMIYEMLQLPGLDNYDLEPLRRIVTGGSAIMPWAIRAMRERLPNVQLLPAYGLTEGTPLATVSTMEDVEKYPDGVGMPFALTEVHVVDNDGVTVPPEHDGEVWVRSPAVAVGYWQRSRESAATFKDGWCKTGDIGQMTVDGVLRITGRQKDMIISGGENVYPIEIETVLTDLDDIIDAAVIGVPDARFQEVVCAVVVRRPGAQLSEADLMTYCRSRLAGYKRPKYTVFVEDLPRNAAGKILKRILREQYERLGSPEGVV
jgi:fatty-acyl-CoA synthase